jgi:hypothetical protein
MVFNVGITKLLDCWKWIFIFECGNFWVKGGYVEAFVYRGAKSVEVRKSDIMRYKVMLIRFALLLWGQLCIKLLNDLWA